MPSAFIPDRKLPMNALFAGILILVVWTLWQSVGIEAMRLPWEDEILYTLPLSIGPPAAIFRCPNWDILWMRTSAGAGICRYFHPWQPPG